MSMGSFFFDRRKVPLSGRIEHCVLLYVEDDDGTAYLFQMLLAENGLHPQVFRVTDGKQALAFLAQTSPYHNAPRPDLVLLDLNLPRKSGFDVLAKMKRNPHQRDIRVVVFSSSIRPYDCQRSLELGADRYLTKGGDFEAFIHATKSICEMLSGSSGPGTSALPS